MFMVTYVGEFSILFSEIPEDSLAIALAEYLITSLEISIEQGEAEIIKSVFTKVSHRSAKTLPFDGVFAAT